MTASLTFCLSLARLHAELVRRFDGRLGALHGLSFSDFIVLHALSRAPGGKLRRVDLAGEIGVTASAVTRILIPLEKIGLVKRERDLRDARVGYATLTRAGSKLLESAMVSAEVVSDGVVPANKSSELESLNALLLELAGAK